MHARHRALVTFLEWPFILWAACPVERSRTTTLLSAPPVITIFGLLACTSRHKMALAGPRAQPSGPRHPRHVLGMRIARSHATPRFADVHLDLLLDLLLPHAHQCTKARRKQQQRRAHASKANQASPRWTGCELFSWYLATASSAASDADGTRFLRLLESSPAILTILSLMASVSPVCHSRVAV
jgi:hypothetical protein